MENKSTLVQRADKVAFYKPKTGEKYFRMKGFTGLSISKNPKEYTRQYVDELFDALLKEVEVEIPHELIHEEIDNMIEQYKERLKMQRQL